MRKDNLYPIRVAARMSGLTPHVIRAWERRYGVVSPIRTDTNRRFYTEKDIKRLNLLRRATALGHSISQVAKLSSEELEGIIKMEEGVKSTQNGSSKPSRMPSNFYYDSCIAAVERLATEDLESALVKAEAELGQTAFIDQLIVPLMHNIGDLWRDGHLRVAHEHFATAVVRDFLSQLKSVPIASSTAPNLVVATPSGQLHDIGALITAVTAVSEGWRVVFFGASLPAEEIAGAVLKTVARAVALSIVYPEDDFSLREELRRLRRFLPEGVSLLVGGRGADSYADVLEEIRAIRVKDMKSFRFELESIRSKKETR
jgi:DNA-binding transcriptional MerR regulator/methylmalonyl-CoA mutase cobalamin-binding subunit